MSAKDDLLKAFAPLAGWFVEQLTLPALCAHSRLRRRPVTADCVTFDCDDCGRAFEATGKSIRLCEATCRAEGLDDPDWEDVATGRGGFSTREVSE